MPVSNLVSEETPMEHDTFERLCEKYNSKIEQCDKHDHARIRELVSELDSQASELGYELPLPFISDFIAATFGQIEKLKPDDIDYDQVSNDTKLTCIGLYTEGIMLILKHWSVSEIEPEGWEKYIRPKLAPMFFDLPDLVPGYAEMLLEGDSSKLTDEELAFLDFLPRGKNNRYSLVHTISLRANSLAYGNEQDEELLTGIKQLNLAIDILYHQDDNRAKMAIGHLTTAREIFYKFARDDIKYGFSDITAKDFLEYTEFNLAYGQAKAGTFDQAKMMLKECLTHFDESSEYLIMVSGLALDLEMPEDARSAFAKIDPTSLNQESKEQYRALEKIFLGRKKGTSKEQYSNLSHDMVNGFEMKHGVSRKIIIFAVLIMLFILFARSC